MNQQEKVVVITGATGGLGRVVAQKFAAAGANLVLVGTNGEKISALKSELNLPADKVLSFSTDLTQPDAAPGLRQAVMDRFTRVDILLHLVGGWIGGKPLDQVTREELTTMLDQHVLTTFYLLKAFTPDMVSCGWGRMIVISSPVVASPPANNIPYTVGKSGQEALVLTMAEELKHTGVTANILRVRTIDVRHERETSPTPKNAAWTTPEEIWSAIEFLCTDAAGAINGARLPLYGSM